MTGQPPPSRSRSGAMSPDDWAQLESMVDALLDTPSERRDALMAELSGGDANRRAELERLLSECERPHPLPSLGIGLDVVLGEVGPPGLQPIAHVTRVRASGRAEQLEPGHGSISSRSRIT